MDKTQPLPPASLNESLAGPVPPNCYLVRIIPKCEAKKSQSSGNTNLTVPFEIIAPDVVPMPTEQDPNNKVRVGGRKGRLYITLEPTAKSYADACAKLRELGLENADGELVPADIVAALNTGSVCWYLLLESQEKIARKPAGPGQKQGEPIKHPITGDPIKLGHEFKYIDIASIISVAETPDDLPPWQGKNAGF